MFTGYFEVVFDTNGSVKNVESDLNNTVKLEITY